MMTSLLRWGRRAAVALLGLVLVGGAVLVVVPQTRTMLAPAPTVTRTQPTPGTFAMPQPTNPVAALWPELVPGTAPDAAALAARVPALKPGSAGKPAIVVADPATGDRLLTRNAVPMIPASTMKLLTGFVALRLMDPATRFATRVVSPGKGRLVLVGGGDPLLTTKPASPDQGSLVALADATVAALPAGTRRVTLGFDARLFTGAAWHRSWGDNYRYSVAPVSALMTDHGSTATGLRVRDPALAAARAFAKALAARGVTVTGNPRPVRATGAAVAQVQSLPLDQIVATVLKHSDNDGAEHLLRLVAIAAGRPGSFADGAAVLTAQLRAQGLWAKGMRVADGSGLSRDNRVSPLVLTAIVGKALTDPQVRPLLTGLPVGGVSGTLWDRFDDKAEYRGRGTVRAKTGSLRDVSTMAGYLVTADHAVVTFAIMTNGVVRPFATRDWIDKTLARIAGCGCG